MKNEAEFNQLLQLKFRLKRLAHFKALTALEQKTLDEVEIRLADCAMATEYMDRLGRRYGAMVG